MNAKDSWNQRYTERNVCTPRGAVVSYIQAYLTRTGAKPETTQVLDYGCGNGRNMLYLLKQGFDVVGFDLSIRGVELARSNLEEQLKIEPRTAEARARVGDMRQPLLYQDNEFNVIINFGVLQQVESRYLPLIFSEMYRVLKKGGEVFFHTRSSNQVQFGKLIESPRYDSDGNRVIVTQGPTLELEIKGIPVMWHFFSEQELKKLSAQAGFELHGLVEFVHSRREEGEAFDRVSWEGILRKP